MHSIKKKKKKTTCRDCISRALKVTMNINRMLTIKAYLTQTPEK